MSHSSPDHIEAASTLAVISSSHEPLLFLDGELRIVAASASFCRSFAIDLAAIVGHRLAEIGDGEWATPQLTSLLRATASGAAQIDAYAFVLRPNEAGRRHLLLNARKLESSDADHVRLLLAITDVSAARAEARQKDDLLREKEVLLQEVQHRVANSLQIIASVLMQSARTVQSEEGRGHLHTAHFRVMSIAAVQRQLAESQLGQVALRPYLNQLCESLGASMILDPDCLSIKVYADDRYIDARASVSLGLIVTELVINALKHAFKDQVDGVIQVEYRADGSDWMLSVNDNGIGIPGGDKAPKSGLGTSIVDALARQLDADILIVDLSPGTSVRIAYKGGACRG